MNIDFPLILTELTLGTGFIWLLDACFFKKMAWGQLKYWRRFADESISFFPVLLAVLVIRSFLITPFLVPTGSLEPTILTHEFIFVNQYAYGLRLPVVNTKIIRIGEPKLGDIAVFRFPGNPKVDFVKRVIGLPGDHIIYKNKTLFINEKKMPQTLIDKNTVDKGENNIPVQLKQEDLNGIKHLIYINSENTKDIPYDFTVPKDYYFMMGDNRDGSLDSRYWGFVPEENLIGKAFMIWLSWDSQKHWFRFHRFGKFL